VEGGVHHTHFASSNFNIKQQRLQHVEGQKCKQLGTIETCGGVGSNESMMKIELNEEDMDLKGRGVEKNKQKIKKVRSEKEF
jgi:hypothetical protein